MLSASGLDWCLLWSMVETNGKFIHLQINVLCSLVFEQRTFYGFLGHVHFEHTLGGGVGDRVGNAVNPSLS